jgi:hypothetical protein
MADSPHRKTAKPLTTFGGVEPDWARSKGAAVHMDGARLWGCEPFYERSLEEISELFDTVYVSFYKQLGGLPGGRPGRTQRCGGRGP